MKARTLLVTGFLAVMMLSPGMASAQTDAPQAGKATPAIRTDSAKTPAPPGNGGISDSQASSDLAEEQKQQAPPTGALEVTATGTLEWLRQDQMYVARQNAVARRNDTTLKGDVLVAHYQVPAGKKSGSEIVQVTADGNPVKLISPTAVAYGQHGVYDLPKHLVLLLGNNLKLVTTDEVVTARDSMEYYEDLDIGVARGDAVMLRGDDKLTADVLAAKFVHQDHGNGSSGGSSARAGSQKAAPPNRPAGASPANGTTEDGDKPKSHSLERLDAKGHVVLTTPTDIVTGDEGVYNPITDQTTIIGNVHVTREDNQLDGTRAEVDMSTGISRMYAAPNTKVHGLFVPKKKEKKNAGEDTAQNTGDTGAAEPGSAQ